MKYVLLILKSPFIAFGWCIFLPIVALVVILDLLTSGSCSAYLSEYGRNTGSTGTGWEDEPDDDHFDTAKNVTSDFDFHSQPDYNTDGSPMLGACDVHGNSFGMSESFDDHFSSCDSGCFDS